MDGKYQMQFRHRAAIQLLITNDLYLRADLWRTLAFLELLHRLLATTLGLTKLIIRKQQTARLLRRWHLQLPWAVGYLWNLLPQE